MKTLFQHDLKVAGYCIWGISSIIILLILFTPFLVSFEWLGNQIPQCEWKTLYQKECLFCGMTTAFYVISSHGNFLEAYSLNQLSPFLYITFVLNQFLISFVFIKKIIKRKLLL